MRKIKGSRIFGLILAVILISQTPLATYADTVSGQDPEETVAVADDLSEDGMSEDPGDADLTDDTVIEEEPSEAFETEEVSENAADEDAVPEETVSDDEVDAAADDISELEDMDVPYYEVQADSSTGVYKKTQNNTLLGIHSLADPSVGKWNDNWKGSYVYYGRYDGNPIKWRILDKKSTDFSKPINPRTPGYPTVLLDCDSVLYESAFKSDGGKVTWDNSTLKPELNGSKFLDKDGVLNAREKSAIRNSYKP